MVKIRNFNPVVVCSVFLAVVIYSGILKLPKTFVKTIVPEPQIKNISGIVISNPVKLSEKFYSLKVKLFECESTKKIRANCFGITTMLIPTQIIEAYYPNKLFSKNKTCPEQSKLYTVEQGAIINASVKYINSKNESFFIIEQIKNSTFERNVKGKLYSIRAYSRIQFKRLMSMWGRAGGLFLALLSGSREYLDENVSKAFRRSGLSHILALSGMHLSLISGIAGFIEDKSILKKIGILIKLLVIAIFVWFAGNSPSLLRAFISCSIISIAKLFNVRKTSGINIICLTFLIHACIKSSDLFNIGFLLSYSALLGIILLSELVNCAIIRFIPHFIGNSLSSSIAANIFTSPICIHYFGFFSPAGIITTVFISPLITLFIYSGLIFMITGFIIPSSVFLSNFCMNFLYNVANEIIKFFTFIPVIQC